MRVTALAGGTGAAKLLRGLAACLASSDARLGRRGAGPRTSCGSHDHALTVIGNTGDDTEIWGLHVSPDLDTVTYALAGLLDVQRGWGRDGETFQCRDALAALGVETWFNLGDRDLATHVHRTHALRSGRALSEVTNDIVLRLGVPVRLLPMSDDPVRTRVRTPEGWLSFQEYFVRERARVKVLEVEYTGAEVARPAPGVVDAIGDADLVVVCPSNPVTSVGPILAVPGIVAALLATSAPVVAVSPIVGGAAVSGPAGDLMRSRGFTVSPSGIAAAYTPWLRVLVLDEADRDEVEEIARLGVRAIVAETVMTDREREIRLARCLLGTAAR